MEQVIIDTSMLRLPKEFAEKIGTECVMIQAIEQGVLLTPIMKKDRKIQRKVDEKLAAFKKLTSEIHELNQTEPLPPEFDEVLKECLNFSRNLDL